MAGRGISIDILANVRDALKGTGDVEKALGDIESTLEDMARSGDQSVDKMSRGFRDLARKSDDSADKIERSYKDAYRDIARAADDTADDGIRAQRRMSDQSAEVGGEIRQNLGEGIANAARGDFESLADTIGDTLGGITAGIGGIGTAAVGVAGALGIGAIVGAIQLANQEAELAKQRVGEWAQAFVDAGGTMLTAGVQAARFQEILTDPEKFAEAERNAKNWGVTVETAITAMAGNEGAIEDVSHALEHQKEVAQDAGRAALDLAMANGSGLPVLTEQEKSYAAGADALSKLTGEMEAGRERAGILNSYYADLIGSAGKLAVEVDELGNKLYTLPDGTQVMVDVETGQATRNLDKFKGDADDVIDHVNGREAVLDIRATTQSARRTARNLINDLNRESATITINSRFGRRFGG